MSRISLRPSSFIKRRSLPEAPWNFGVHGVTILNMVKQFKAEQAIETKPASSAALEKYLGSGLIKGVGPKTATKIVKFFKRAKPCRSLKRELMFLLNVPGIAEKKLLDIKNSWQEHKAIRDVMLFLQGYGISTLFAS